MEFLEGRKFNRDEIMAMFSVPLTVAGFTGNETYASAKASSYAFATNTIDPKMEQITNKLNEFYLPLFENTEGMFYEHVSPILEDRELIVAGYEKGLHKWLTINDVRRMEDLPEIEGGDEMRGPINLIPIGGPIAKSVKEDPITKMAEEIASKICKDIESVHEDDEEEEDEDRRTDEEKIFDAKGEIVVKQRDERGLEFENLFRVILRQLWDAQAQRAINNLVVTLNQKDWKVTGPNVIDREREVETTIDLMTPLMTEITEVEGLSAAEFLGIAADDIIILTPKVTKQLEANVQKLAGEMTRVTSDRLRSTIAAGIEEGESINDLEKRILDSTAFSPARAENIARTETVRAQGKAELQVWEESGVVIGKVWYTALDERVCPFCKSMHGKTFTLKERIFSRGQTLDVIDDQGVERSLNFDYETVTAPPLHPQCRCVLLPEIKTK